MHKYLTSIQRNPLYNRIRARIGEVVPNSPAADAGLQPGDVIFAVDGTDVQNTADLGYQIRLNLGHWITMTVRRQDATGAEFVDVRVYARWSAPNYTDAVLALARTNFQSGATQPAIEDLERLLAKQPALVSGYVLLGAGYLSQRKPAQAAELARKLIALAPQDARGPDILGLSLAMQGKRTEAVAEFEKSLALAPGYLDPLNHLVGISVADKQVGPSIERVKRQIVLVPRSGPHHALLGELQILNRDAKAAEEAFLKATELDPGLVGPYLSLGNLYAQTGRYEEAIAKLEQAARSNPRNPAPVMIAGIVHEFKGDIPKAREAYEKVLAMNPRIAAAANNLAWIYSEHGGDKEKALQLAQTAKQLAPDDPRISDTLGWILYKRGVYQTALAHLKESAAKLGNNPQVQYHLGMAYQQVGEKEAARTALQAAANSPATFPGKEEARKALAELR